MTGATMRPFLALLPLTLLPLAGGCAYPGSTADTGDTGSATTTTDTATPTTGVAATVTDTFVAGPSGPVDVLVAVDPGLAPDVVSNAPILIDWLLGSGVDWHLGFVSNAQGDPATVGVMADLGGQPYLDDSVVDPAALLGAWQVPTAAPVGAFGATWTALETLGGTTNDGFLRADSSLHLLILAEGDDATPAATIDEASWRAWLDALRPDPALRSVSVLAPPTAATLRGVAADYDGQLWDSGAAWHVVLEDAGIHVAELTRSFPLTHAADPATIEVSVLENDVRFVFDDTDWTYDAVANVLTFDQYVPGVGATVEIVYVPSP